MLALSVVAVAQAQAPGRATTLDERIVKGEEMGSGFFELTTADGQPLVVRDGDDGLGISAQSGRESRRESLTYFSQLTDFQLADEESPARVEFADDGASSAWRPHEAFHPFAIDQSMRRLNTLLKSPIVQGNGERARMQLAVLTGDQADNQQFNETLWVRQLVEPGSTLNPGSGTSDYTRCDPATRVALERKRLAGEPNYVGVQDYDDFARAADYYDPDEPYGDFDNWPRYQGLMDRAQRPFTTAGLKVPTYVVDGNHDGLVQGNEDANQVYERIATGCNKVRASNSTADPGDAESPNPNLLLSPAGSEPVPPDPQRRFVSKGEVRQIFAAGKQSDDHGFAFVEDSEDGADAANGTAWYYAWNPRPGLEFIVVDTISEGGTVQDSSEGNIDDPQFKWLERKLQAADDAGRLIVVFGHHPIGSLISETPDEAAPACAGGYNDQGEYVGADRDPEAGHNHALNPGCDADRRPSTPLHNGAALVALLKQHEHVIAYVAGHTHENEITAYSDGNGGGFWELNTSAVADWPQQSRLIDIMDNKDGTLSIFGVVTDHASEVGIPSPGSASGFSNSILGALGRTFSFNDPDVDLLAEGAPTDRNVELLIRDPREGAATPQSGSDDSGGDGERQTDGGGDADGEGETGTTPTQTTPEGEGSP